MFRLFLKHFEIISDKYTVNEMEFRWRKDHPLTFPNDFGENGFRLPKYVVSFYTHEKPHTINFNGDGKSAVYYNC